MNKKLGLVAIMVLIISMVAANAVYARGFESSKHFSHFADTHGAVPVIVKESHHHHIHEDANWHHHVMHYHEHGSNSTIIH